MLHIFSPFYIFQMQLNAQLNVALRRVGIRWALLDPTRSVEETWSCVGVVLGKSVDLYFVEKYPAYLPHGS